MKAETENFIANGIDESNRRIFFGKHLHTADPDNSNSFDQVSVEHAIRAIHKMSSSSKKPIEIHMSSYGGDVYSMMYLHDIIMTTSCQFKFYGGGIIASAAAWIMAACDERFLYPNTKIMLHDPQISDLNASTTDLKIEEREMSSLKDELMQLFANNSKMPKSFWEDVCQRDLHISSEEAVSLGLADSIIPYRKRGTFRKNRIKALEQIDNVKLHRLVKKLYNRVNMGVKVKELTIVLPKEENDNTLIIEENKPIQEKPNE